MNRVSTSDRLEALEAMQKALSIYRAAVYEADSISAATTIWAELEGLWQLLHRVSTAAGTKADLVLADPVGQVEARR